MAEQSRDGAFSRGLRAFGKTVFAGMAITVPFIISIAVIYWLATSIESVVRSLYRSAGGAELPHSNLGFAIATFLGVVGGVAAFWLIGTLTRMYVGRKLVQLVESLLLYIPLVKSLYEATRDMMRFFGGEKTRGSKVVYVSLAGGQIQMLGLLTNAEPRGYQHHADEPPGRVAVWLPMSYQLGGFMIYVRPEQIRPANMTVEQAMKICATADMG